jgi:signal peptidase I
MPEPKYPSTTAELHMEALRQGQPLWFRVASDSMDPTLQKGDIVYIVPAKAQELRLGEIAAFGTTVGSVIHRIVRIEQNATTCRLLQMADVNVDIDANFWLKEKDIVGRVVVIRRDNLSIDLQHPVAQRWGRVTAHFRYQLYRLYGSKKSGLLRAVLTKALRGCSRLVVRMSSWSIRLCCASVVSAPIPLF